MNLNPLILSGVALGLSACVSVPAPQKGTAALAGAYAVAHEGGSYAAQVGAGRPGHALGTTKQHAGRACDLGQLFRPDHDQGDGTDESQFTETDIEHGSVISDGRDWQHRSAD